MQKPSALLTSSLSPVTGCKKCIAMKMFTLVATLILPASALCQTAIQTYSADTSLGALGVALHSGGDIDNDGYLDIIAGDNQDSTHTGAVKVFSGKDQSTLYTFRGEAGNDNFGFAVGGAKDVNADGYPDVIVGSFGASPNGSESGNIKVFSGKDGSTLFDIDGENANDVLGYSVDLVGDINNDGIGDLGIGIPGANTSRGVVKIISGADSTAIHTIQGSVASEHLGSAIDAVGDINKDGTPDFIVGGVGGAANGAESGTAVIFSGADASELFRFDGAAAGDRLGHSTALAGDVNKDSYPDVIVGIYHEDTNGLNAGAAKVFSGKDGTLIYTFYGDSAGDSFGYSVGGNADVNNDGYDDIFVAAIFDGNNGSNSGSVRVFSGKDGSTIATIDGQGTGNQLGEAVAAVGDINKDGLDDILIGSPKETLNGKRGVVRVYSFENIDFCEEDPNKTNPGDCGCGVADTDNNDNGISDCLDEVDNSKKIKKLKKKIRTLKAAIKDTRSHGLRSKKDKKKLKKQQKKLKALKQRLTELKS